MYCQCISYAYAYVSEEFRNTESHNLKIAKIQDFVQKSGHVSEIHRYNYLGGELFVETAVYKPKRTAHRRWGNFCAKSVLFLKYQISFVVAYMLMTSGVCVWPSLHLILYMFSCVFVIIGVCVGKLVL